MDAPDTILVAVHDRTRERKERLYRRRVRTRAYALAGLAVSGWVGFLVLAGILLIGKPGATSGYDARAEASMAAPLMQAVAAPEAATPGSETATPAHEPKEAAATKPVSEPQPVAILTTYEERRRVQEQVRHADATDHEHGNVSAARSFYEYATRKGWAPAALALAFTYDPHELRRRDVAIAANPAKARACYQKARELMNATVAFYLSRLPPGLGEKC